jgi:hypothetical protein
VCLGARQSASRSSSNAAPGEPIIVVVVVDVGHGFGSQLPSPMGVPPTPKQPGGFNRKQAPATQHRSIIVMVDVDVVLTVVVTIGQMPSAVGCDALKRRSPLFVIRLSGPNRTL